MLWLSSIVHDVSDVQTLSVFEMKDSFMYSCEFEFQSSLKSLLSEFKDVFPDKLPQGLPTFRGELHHAIKIVQNSHPISKPSRSTYGNRKTN